VVELEEQIRERVRAELSSRRFGHTVGVVKTAEQLAQRYGVSPGRARMAAWIHDLAREWPIDKLVQYAEKVEVPTGFGRIPELLHGPIAAALLREWFGVVDEEMANAVRYHTTGRIGMTVLDQIIYLADAIEPGRKYDGVDSIRQLASTNLSRALAESIDNTLRYLLNRRQPIFPLTVMVRNDLWEEILSEKGEASV
jgi:predicted HD superfamily hydrolase involved in NAD metabolism